MGRCVESFELAPLPSLQDILDLTFTAEVDYFGRKELLELKPGGARIRVTEENKKEYVRLMARHVMTTAIREQISAFLQGFWDIVPRELVAILDDNELELLIRSVECSMHSAHTFRLERDGNRHRHEAPAASSVQPRCELAPFSRSGLPEIDIEDLRANTEYQGYTAASPVVQWFWDVVRELDQEDKARLLQFVTGTSKVPLEGFKALQGVSGPQKFQIQKAFGPTDRLPQVRRARVGLACGALPVPGRCIPQCDALVCFIRTDLPSP